MHSKTKAAFTLVELAIVMVIMGLISGGILAGQDLIRSAQIRKTARQIEETETGVLTFLAKYGHLPGDLPNPQIFFPTSNYTNYSTLPGHGDGNGLIEGLSSASTVTTTLASAGEPAVFFHQLYDAGYIKETMTYADLDPGTYNLAESATNNGMFLTSAIGKQALIAPFADTQHNYLLLVGLATGPAVAGAVASSPAMTPLQAKNIDLKFDDGAPGTGKVVSTNNLAPSGTLGSGRPLATPVVDGVDCYDTIAADYLLRFTKKSCSLAIRASF